MRYLKTLPRRFKNGFREGAYSDTDGVRATRFSVWDLLRGTLRAAAGGERAARARGASRSSRASVADGFRDRRPARQRPNPGWRGARAARGDRTVTRERAWRGERDVARRGHGPLACRVSTTRPSRPTPRPSRPDHSPPVAARRGPTRSLAATRSLATRCAPCTLGADLSSPMYDPSSLQARRPSPRSAPPPIKRDLRRALAMGSPRGQLLMGS